MTPGGRSRFTGRMIAGGLLILVGVLFTLDAFGWIHAGDLFEYWPLILVGVGLSRILQGSSPHERQGGFVLAGIGVILLFFTLDFVSVRRLWPVLLLVLGGWLIWRAMRDPRVSGSPAAAGTESASGAPGEPQEQPLVRGSTLNEFAMMGGGDRVVRAQDFQGGSVAAIMGGFEIDLRGAARAGDTATIDVFTLWGGIDFRIPEDWAVIIEGVPILGVFTHTASGTPPEAPKKTLILKGAAIMGGIEVKS